MADIAVWEHFAAALNEFQREIVLSRDEAVRGLRITACEAPAPVVPGIHNTPYAGFAVTKTDIFRVRLSNGKFINSTGE